MKTPFLSLVLLLVMGVLPASLWAAQARERVLAGESVARPATDSFVVQGSTWIYTPATLPVSKFPKEAPERTVFYDAKAIELLFLGADPAVPYTAEFVFLSDSANRALAISAGGAVLEKRLALPKAQILTRRYTIPATAIQNGELRLSLKPVSGPNAVLSSFKILSTDPAARPLKPRRTPIPSVPTVRLTPRPATVAGVQTTSLTLNGTWSFNPAPPADFWKTKASADWKPIAVPGEWTMQGFNVTTGTAAGYRRAFTVPGDWSGHRVMLRFDGVYAESRVWVNGQPAGAHNGGFTPFELDITGLVRDGQNDLALAVSSRGTKSDGLASGNRYAEHDLGGIPRKVTLFTVPQAHINSLHVTTTFDDQTYRDATLMLAFGIINNGADPLPGTAVDFQLLDPAGQSVPVRPLDIGVIKAGKTHLHGLAIPVAAPLHWNNEHPNLYRLVCTLKSAGRPLETVTQNVGFRQVEVRGNQLFVNGRAIKLRGVCRHETHPTLGRALTPELWEQDARLFRDGNVNYIRTSHYPPAEEFLDWCDRLGLFVESEAPLCWAPAAWVPSIPMDPAAVPEYIVRPALEMVEFNRNHPSIIIWSLGNESQKWREYFVHSAAAVKAADPSRPRNFSGSQDQGVLEIAGPHYPGPDGPAKYAPATRPTVFDEFIHLNCYNRRELVTDPGLRDFWGPGSDQMWNAMRKSQGTLGGAIWAAIDDHFFLPGGAIVGYGPWGPLDNWRRPKPEFWHMKKIYSPLRIDAARVDAPAPGQPLRIPIENRFDFTDLGEVRFVCELDGKSGELTVAAAPQTRGEIVLPGEPHSGQTIQLKAFSPQGYLVDEWNINVGEKEAAARAPQSAGKLKLERAAGALIVSGSGFRCEVDGQTGMIRNATAAGQKVLAGGPALMILPKVPPTKADTQFGGRADYEPFTPVCADWQASEVAGDDANGDISIKVHGEYKEAKGGFVLRFGGNGMLTINYDFTLKQKIDPRQIGIVLALPRACDSLSWRREGYWSAYPSDHIGRPVGQTRAFYDGIPLTTQAGPATAPAWPWSHDANALGCNDFRSTKLNIREAALVAQNGSGVRVVSDGRQHARSWIEGESVRLLVADYANEGAASFFTEHAAPDRPLAPGDRIQGSAQIHLEAPGTPSANDMGR